MSTDKTLAAENILQSLEVLGGWATVKELALKSGYSGDWTNRTVNCLVDTGVLQKSKLSPYLFSLSGKTLAAPLPETPIREADDIKALAKAAAHTTGRASFLETYLTGGISNMISLGTLLKLANLAGYDLLLVKKK